MVTAAHCPTQLTPEQKANHMEMRVVVGASDIKDVGKYRWSKKLVPDGDKRHPEYTAVYMVQEDLDGKIVRDPSTNQPLLVEMFSLYDVMVVEFDPVQFSKHVKPVLLPPATVCESDIQTIQVRNENSKLASQIRFAGWGSTLANKIPFRDSRPIFNHGDDDRNTYYKENDVTRLQKMEVKVLTKRECRDGQTYGEFFKGFYGEDAEVFKGFWDENGRALDIDHEDIDTFLCVRGLINKNSASKMRKEPPQVCRGDSGCKSNSV